MYTCIWRRLSNSAVICTPRCMKFISNIRLRSRSNRNVLRHPTFYALSLQPLGVAEHDGSAYASAERRQPALLYLSAVGEPAGADFCAFGFARKPGASFRFAATAPPADDYFRLAREYRRTAALAGNDGLQGVG